MGSGSAVPVPGSRTGSLAEVRASRPGAGPLSAPIRSWFNVSASLTLSTELVPSVAHSKWVLHGQKDPPFLHGSCPQGCRANRQGSARTRQDMGPYPLCPLHSWLRGLGWGKTTEPRWESCLGPPQTLASLSHCLCPLGFSAE